MTEMLVREINKITSPKLLDQLYNYVLFMQSNSQHLMRSMSEQKNRVRWSDINSVPSADGASTSDMIADIRRETI
ncbi:hypothetical protein FACS1894199_10580 [Bacteroidia bacterium]|nr:hypothetical protein FACS1894199_10580 [Bacteroidia bacterium]